MTCAALFAAGQQHELTVYAHLRPQHAELREHRGGSVLEQHQLERLTGSVDRCDDSPERDEVNGATVVWNFRRPALRVLLIWVLIVARAVVLVIAVAILIATVVGPALPAAA